MFVTPNMYLFCMSMYVHPHLRLILIFKVLIVRLVRVPTSCWHSMSLLLMQVFLKLITFVVGDDVLMVLAVMIY